MGSHGVPRIQPVLAQRSEEELQKEKVKIDSYQSLVGQINEAIRRREFTENTLAMTSKILTQNPEYYTEWNNRRRVLQHILDLQLENTHSDQQQERIRSLISSDLEFIFPLQVNYPKCYWIWNHRLWLLQQASSRLPVLDARKFWQQELLLVGKMLARDNRNFHGWDYRRRVVAEIEKLNVAEHSPDPDHADVYLTKSEFDYTTKMIKSDLSNFSAWHNRSKLLPKLLDEQAASPEERRKTFDSELSLSRNAVLFDPYDQSLWFYHQFLITMLHPEAINYFATFNNQQRLEYIEREVNAIRELLEDTDDCKFVYQYLLHYVSMYLNLEGGNKFVTTAEMRSWLSKLKSLDKLRIGRWNDLEASLNL